MNLDEKELSDISSEFNKAIDQMEKTQEEFWSLLSKEEQLDAFCCVMRRLYRGEIEERRSYRGVLYDTFEFGPESYLPAQVSGYLSVHNAIFDACEIDDIVKKAIDNFFPDNQVTTEDIQKHLVKTRYM